MGESSESHVDNINECIWAYIYIYIFIYLFIYLFCCKDNWIEKKRKAETGEKNIHGCNGDPQKRFKEEKPKERRKRKLEATEP